jgi:hypothetical protein
MYPQVPTAGVGVARGVLELVELDVAEDVVVEEVAADVEALEEVDDVDEASVEVDVALEVVALDEAVPTRIAPQTPESVRASCS